MSKPKKNKGVRDDCELCRCTCKIKPCKNPAKCSCPKHFLTHKEYLEHYTKEGKRKVKDIIQTY